LGEEAFKYGGEYRLWVYEYAPELVDHACVRVTYAKDLLFEPNSREPAFRPFTVGAEGQLITDPMGHTFLKKGWFFNPYNRPAREIWKPAEAITGENAKANRPWHMSRVLKDVRKTATHFTVEKQNQWAAMAAFHTLYTTADSVPSFPLRIPGTTYVMQCGPADWTYGWSKLAFRFARPHHPNYQTPHADLPSATHRPAPTGRRADRMGPQGPPLAGLADVAPVPTTTDPIIPVSPRALARYLAVQNRVTGSSAPERDQIAALAQQRREHLADTLPEVRHRMYATACALHAPPKVHSL
jgi:hypothetical protein